MESGYFKLGTFGGAPIRVHWTAPLGAFVFCGFRFAPAAWVAFVVLILIHELGHAFFVRYFRLHLASIDVHGFGGVCAHEATTPLRNSVIAWGGVLAQAIVLAIAVFVTLVLPPIHNPHWADVLDTFLRTNLY